MKVYRGVLIAILVLTICYGIWYCVSAYNEQRQTERGLLVWEERDAGTDLY